MVTARAVPLVTICYLRRQTQSRWLDLPNEILTEDLDIALAHFYRQEGIFRTSPRTETRFLNHCNEATHSFGRILLNRQYGDSNQSFFEAHDAIYFDVRSNGPFRSNYGNFHSLALIAIPQQSEFIAIDLTHNMADNKDERRAALFHGHDASILFSSLQEYYGGIWKGEFIFNPARNQYLWLDGKTIEDFISVG